MEEHATAKVVLLEQNDYDHSLSNFPAEVLLQIFAFCISAEDLCSLSCVCRAFHSVADDNQLWARLGNPSWKLPRGSR